MKQASLPTAEPDWLVGRELVSIQGSCGGSVEQSHARRYCPHISSAAGPTGTVGLRWKRYSGVVRRSPSAQSPQGRTSYPPALSRRPQQSELPSPRAEASRGGLWWVLSYRRNARANAGEHVERSKTPTHFSYLSSAAGPTGTVALRWRRYSGVVRRSPSAQSPQGRTPYPPALSRRTQQPLRSTTAAAPHPTGGAA